MDSFCSSHAGCLNLALLTSKWHQGIMLLRCDIMLLVCRPAHQLAVPVICICDRLRQVYDGVAGCLQLAHRHKLHLEAAANRVDEPD